MVNELEPKYIGQVVHLLEPTGQGTDVAEALLYQLSDQEAKHIFVELANRDLAGLLLGRLLSIC